MSTSAIILMIIGCAGLWGGFGVSCAIAVDSVDPVFIMKGQ